MIQETITINEDIINVYSANTAVIDLFRCYKALTDEEVASLLINSKRLIKGKLAEQAYYDLRRITPIQWETLKMEYLIHEGTELDLLYTASRNNRRYLIKNNNINMSIKKRITNKKTIYKQLQEDLAAHEVLQKIEERKKREAFKEENRRRFLMNESKREWMKEHMPTKVSHGRLA